MTPNELTSEQVVEWMHRHQNSSIARQRYRDTSRTLDRQFAYDAELQGLEEKLLNHDAALRHTIKQQAQEIATLTGKLTSLCHAHGNALIEIHDLKQVIDSIHSSLHGKA